MNPKRATRDPLPPLSPATAVTGTGAVNLLPTNLVPDVSKRLVIEQMTITLDIDTGVTGEIYFRKGRAVTLSAATPIVATGSGATLSAINATDAAILQRYKRMDRIILGGAGIGTNAGTWTVLRNDESRSLFLVPDAGVTPSTVSATPTITHEPVRWIVATGYEGVSEDYPDGLECAAGDTPTLEFSAAVTNSEARVKFVASFQDNYDRPFHTTARYG